MWCSVLLLLAAALSAAVASLALNRPFAGWQGDHVDVELPAGMDAGSMLDRLDEAGVIRDSRVIRGWLRLSGDSRALQAGEYRFSEAASPLAVLSRLAEGDVLLREITIPEGLSLRDIADRLSKEGFATREELLQAFRDPGPIGEIDPQANDLEGYLFPETYRFSKQTTAEQIAAAMVARFKEVTGPDYEARAEAVGLSARQAVTLASLVEKETSLPEERTRISRVFHNRLRIGMRLQCDPTVIYALERTGRDVKRLTYDDLEFESPYNTYLVAGLPPGPIASAGEGSLLAAVEPAEGKELYFVAAPKGGHRFSNDLESHLKAVKEWRAYLRSSR
jgi:UPF0755 protein